MVDLEQGNLKFLSPGDQLGQRFTRTREDQTLGRGLQRSQLDIGAVRTRDHSHVAAATEELHGGVHVHRTNGQGLDQKIVPLRATEGPGIEAASQFLDGDAAQQRRAGHHPQHRQAKPLEGGDHISAQGRHLGGGHSIEHHPSQQLTQLIARGEQGLNAAAVVPGVDEQHWRLQALGHLGQAQSIETAIVEAA